MDIEKIINDWDLYLLLPFAPKDEYKDEISKINIYVKTNQSIDRLTKYLEQIFDVDIIFVEEKKDFLKIVKKILNSAH
ncbi:DUF1871 domain-containing protein [Anaerococcus sp. Marseille-P9784]|uniref:DUF1871 domain-containing protein n=1 Tax=Anaerococcus sp. Marseille-P9784 TaxID=2614127 RepID=UPI001249DD55|nr:DUF1871 domain-containing protein [Anaerococcus sp. Marseille-P9784]